MKVLGLMWRGGMRVRTGEAIMSAQADWVIPTITASASLVGAMVGGFATYWTSKKTHERQTAAEDQRKRFALLREFATRFVNAMTDISVASVGFQEISS
jgi:hypothetical protein